MIWVSYASDTCASPVATGETVSGYIHRYILLLPSMLRFRSDDNQMRKMDHVGF